MWLRRRWAVIWRVIGGASLRIKIMGIALVMIVLLGLGLTWQARVTMARALTWELEQRAVSSASNLAVRSTDLILTNNLYDLYELTRDTVLANEDVRYAFVLDSQGHILSHSFDDGFPTDLLEANGVHPDQHYHLETLQTEEGLIQDVAVPIFEGRAGVARVGISLRRLDDTLAEVTRRFLLTTLLISLLGVAVSTALTWLLARPVLALAEATRRVTHGDLSYRLTPWANDEIGQLQVSSNVMIEHLARSRQEMESSNLRLLRRNRELSALNTVSRAVAGSLELTQVLERALQQTISVVRTTGGWICTLEGDGSCEICVVAGEPTRPGIVLACCQGCPACREAAQARQPLIVDPLPPTCPLRASTGADGRPPSGHVAVPLLIKGQTVGLLNLVCEEENRFEAQDLELLGAIGRQLGIAVENARLWAEVRRKEAMRGELLRKIITAQEEERRRIARELHDEAGQALTSLLIGLRVMGAADTLEETQTLASSLRKVVAQTMDAIHDLALELRPSVLDDLGLVHALARYIQGCPTRFDLRVDFVTAGLDGQRLPLEVETTLYRIAQETLTNVARHSGASHASVLLERRKGAVVLVVEDDGRGFDVAQAMASPEKRKRLGLYGVEERASLVGGQLTLESRPGAGTTISVEIPLEEAWLATKSTKKPMDNRLSAS